MSTTNHYDLIVVGPDLAGLVAAALVAKRGKRVLLAPHGPANATYRLGRHELPLADAPLDGLASPAGERVLDELGLWTQVRRELRPLDAPVHWVLPNHRVDLEPGRAQWKEEVSREWPKDPVEEAFALRDEWSEVCEEVFGAAIDGGSAMIGEGLRAKRQRARLGARLPPSSVDELEPLPANHPVRAAARALEPWVQSLSPMQLGKAASLRVARAWRDGPRDRAGGEAALRAELLQRIKLGSGDVKASLRVSEVLVKRGRVTGIGLLGKSERYGCEQLIISGDPWRMSEGPYASEALAQVLQVPASAVSPVARRFVLHALAPSSALSPALRGIACCVPAGEGWLSEHGVGMTYVRRHMASNGNERITITSVVGEDEPLEHLRERLFDELHERGVLAFLRGHAALIHSPHDGRPATDGHGKVLRALGSDTGMRMPMRRVYASQRSPRLGLALLPVSMPVKNLGLAGTLTYPGLGLEGELLAGARPPTSLHHPERPASAGAYCSGGAELPSPRTEA